MFPPDAGGDQFSSHVMITAFAKVAVRMVCVAIWQVTAKEDIRAKHGKVTGPKVVAAAIERFQGRVTVCPPRPELVDPEHGGRLRTVAGLTRWKVPDPTSAKPKFFEEFDSVPAELTKADGKRASVTRTMFPAEPMLDDCGPDQGDNSTAGQLKRCIRLLPHHNDAGGFFCAVMMKELFPGDKDDAPTMVASDLATDDVNDKPAALPKSMTKSVAGPMPVVRDAMFANKLQFRQMDPSEPEFSILIK